MWSVRRATSLDRAALADLCREAVGPDDYVLAAQDDILHREVVFVASDADRIVGMTAYREVLDGSAWLSAARTHPAHQRKGVASAILRAIDEHARAEGRTTLRLWTEATNVAGHATFRKNGFRELGRFTRMAAKAASAPAGAAFERLSLTPATWDRILGSRILQASNYYLPYDYAFVDVSRATMGRLRERGLLWSSGSSAALMHEMDSPSGAPFLEFQPLFGDAAPLIRDALGIASARGLPRVETFLPHDPTILGVADAAGFRRLSWGQEAVLCEKVLS